MASYTGYGKNTCGKSCVLLKESFSNDYPSGFGFYSKSDHVHAVVLTSGKTVHFDKSNKGNLFFSFRGTFIWDIVNSRRNSDKALHVSSLCHNCAVNSGPYKNFISLRGSILATLNKAELIVLAASLEPEIVIIGMSMGSQMASFAGAYLRVQTNKAISHIYTFGSPRTGNSVFRKFMEQIPNVNFCLYRDPIPHWPLRFWGFRHVAAEQYFLYIDPVYFAMERRGEEPTYYNYLSFKRFIGQESDRKMSGMVSFFDAADHTLYFLGLSEEALATCGGFDDSFIRNTDGTALFL